ncbi:MAG: hypothetical protein M3O82_07360 [Verrucomicrobiota bacterium]|nr:hypothetical protein [Verrucomicrobiota bacterium]
MRISRKCFCLVIFAALASVRADTVTLKSGDKIEGKITSESDTEIRVEIKVSPVITDEKVIPRENIEKVEKETAESIAYGDVKPIGPGLTSLTAAQYDERMVTLKSFLEKYPDSLHTPDIEAKLEALRLEKARVGEGQFKMGGTWIRKEEVEKRRYQIQAELTYNSLRDLAARGDMIGALNTFDRIEKDYPGARIFPEAIDLARKLVSVLMQDVDRRLLNFKRELEEQAKGIELQSEPQKSESKAALLREQERYEQIMADAEGSDTKWKPLLPRSEKSLKTLKTIATAETRRLGAQKVEKMRDSIRHVDKAHEALESRAADTAGAELKEAQKLWGNNETIAYLANQLTTLRLELAATPTPTAIPTVTPSVRASPVPAAATAPAVAVGTGPTTVVPPAPVVRHTPLPPPPPEKSFFLTIPGAAAVLGIILLIGAAVALVGRVRKPKETVEVLK